MSAASFACCRRVSVPRQGASNAAVAAGVVWLYFDLGGAVNGNLGTFPPELRRFCFSTHPPVVLSHWDWDHWSSASRDPRAQAETWIVPRQGAAKGLGPVHRTLLARLLQRGRVLVWPQGLRALRVAAYELLACTGTTRNDGGLALAFERTIDGRPGGCFCRATAATTACRARPAVSSRHSSRPTTAGARSRR
jgi:hypothetical protein